MMRIHLPLLVTLLVTPAAGQNADFVRALDRAAASRPGVLASAARIAPGSEPGTPLVIHGRAFSADGESPAPNVVVFAYHTDTDGLYDRPGAPDNSWRLKGWAKTDAGGRFEFRTIRPGPYPAERVPAHVHFILFAPDGARYQGGELRFSDDPFLTAAHRETSRAAGEFGWIHEVRREGSVQHVNVRLKLDAGRKF